MDADEIDALNTPGYANHEELQALNKKMDQLLQKMDLVLGKLSSIDMNTKPRPNMGSSYTR